MLKLPSSLKYFPKHFFPRFQLRHCVTCQINYSFHCKNMSHQKFIRLNFQKFPLQMMLILIFKYKPFAIFFRRHLILSVTCTLPSIITVGDARVPLSIFNMISTIVNSCCRRLCSCCAAALWWFIFKVNLVQKFHQIGEALMRWQGLRKVVSEIVLELWNFSHF